MSVSCLGSEEVWISSRHSFSFRSEFYCFYQIFFRVIDVHGDSCVSLSCKYIYYVDRLKYDCGGDIMQEEERKRLAFTLSSLTRGISTVDIDK